MTRWENELLAKGLEFVVAVIIVVAAFRWLVL